MTQPATVAARLLRGERYELDEELGRGGVAVTHRAHDRRLGRWVAVKSLVPDPNPEVAAAARARFLREARTLARFHDDNIVRVFEAFEEGGTAHLVTEYLHGRTMSAELQARGHALGVDEALEIAAGVGRALALVHAAGLLHRDVSPSNVMLVTDGRGRRPVLIDFGLARDVTDATDVLTRMVTPGFAPPEQYGGDPARCGPATDVYGLAATLYHGLGGRLPAAAIDRQGGAELVPLRRLRPDVPRYVSDAVHDGLELDPAHRPQTVPVFLARLGLPDNPLPVALRPTETPPPTELEDHSARIRSAGPREPGGDEPPPPPPPPPWRWLATAPLATVAAALCVAAPVVGMALLVLAALPTLATIGDLRRGRRRLSIPWRLVRNAAQSTIACLPAIGLVSLAVVTAVLLDHISATTALDDVVAAAGGAAGALAACRAVGSDRWSFAAPDALDVWQARATQGRSLLGPGFAAWAVAIVAVMGALALHPDLWPLPG
jgi:serine/threonine-protein kinase